MPSPEAQVDKNEALLLKTIEALDKKIATLIATLEVKNGRLVSNAINLSTAIKMRLSIAKEFADYNEAAAIVTDYSPIQKDLVNILKKAGIDEAFTKADASLIKAFSDDGLNELASLGSQYASSVSSEIYAGVAAGASLDDMTENVRQLLIGGTDKAGRSLSSHAATIAETRYMEVDATVLKKKSEEFDIHKFKYAGTLIKDSRPWCIDHVGKIFTEEEIEEWESQTWKGKKAGDPFITRGGWRCRHRWLPIVDNEE